jgi:radical SAM superfamily enzyme YgiQ (UPF0313 family)
MDFCDYVVRNEGEKTFVELVEYLEGRGSLEDILGLTYRAADGRVVHNPTRPLLDSLTDLPWPDLSLVVGGEKVSPTPILASRGCPYGCEFCSVVQMFGRKVRVIDSRTSKVQGAHKALLNTTSFFIRTRGKELLRDDTLTTAVYLNQ